MQRDIIRIIREMIFVVLLAGSVAPIAEAGEVELGARITVDRNGIHVGVGVGARDQSHQRDFNSGHLEEREQRLMPLLGLKKNPDGLFEFDGVLANVLPNPCGDDRLHFACLTPPGGKRTCKCWPIRD